MKESVWSILGMKSLVWLDYSLFWDVELEMRLENIEGLDKGFECMLRSLDLFFFMVRDG